MQINNTQGRKKEVVDICLQQFAQKGLCETTSRDLSAALRLQNAGIYYYFQTKDEVVIACAEEAAAMRLEKYLIMDTLHELQKPDAFMNQLCSRADEMRPMMKFLTCVFSTSRFDKAMQPILARRSKRYQHYAKILADKIGCNISEVEPYVYMRITAVSNYMIFEESVHIEPQIEKIKIKLDELLHKNKQ